MEPPRPERGVAKAAGRLDDDGMVADRLFAVTALEDEMPLIAEPLLIVALPNANALPVVPDGAVPEPRIDR
jgi:hypothetical protein